MTSQTAAPTQEQLARAAANSWKPTPAEREAHRVKCEREKAAAYANMARRHIAEEF